jgi:DnaD/phage-associated family protein
MKYTILGFSQRRAVELDLDLKHLMVLRWFIDFKDSGKMTTKIFEDDKYYWVKYEGLIEALPILKTASEDTVYRYLKKLVKVGVLKHRTLKQSGVWSFYTVGDLYKELIDDDYEFGNKSEVVGNKSDGNGKSSERNGKKIGTNNSSIKDTSINNNSINNTTKEVVKYVEKTLGIIGPNNTLQLLSFIDDGVETDVIISAIDLAVGSGKRNYNYVKGILNNWLSQGIKNSAHLTEHLESIKTNKKTYNNSIHESKGNYNNSGVNNYGKCSTNNDDKFEVDNGAEDEVVKEIERKYGIDFSKY